MPTPHRSIRVSAAARTDAGRVRARNEDRFVCDAASGVFLVVDGVGGHAAGDVAADMACALIARRLRLRTGTAAERVREALAAANNAIYEAAKTPEHAGMACVATLALVEGDGATVGHVGDARLYHLRDGRLRKITRDHAPVGMQEDAGLLDEASAMRHPRRSEILRDLGAQPRDPDDTDFADVYTLRLAPGDALVLCTDGLTDLVPAAGIEALVREHGPDPAAVVGALVEAANAAGGHDNVTVVYARAEAEDGGGPRRALRRSLAARRAARSPRRARGGRARAALRTGLWVVLVLLLAAIPLRPERAETRPAPEAPPAPVAAPPSPAPRTLRVGAGAAFETLGAALAEARDGDRIVLAAGSYAESAVVRSRLEIRAAEGAEAVLRGDAGAAPVVRVLPGGDLALRDVRIEPAPGASAPHALDVQGGRAVLEHVEIGGARGAGIRLAGAARLRLDASAVTDNAGPGLLLADARAHVQATGNLIARNGAASGQAGVLVEAGRVDLVRNVIVGNAGPGIQVSGLSPARRIALRDANFFDVDGERNAGAPVVVE